MERGLLFSLVIVMVLSVVSFSEVVPEKPLRAMEREAWEYAAKLLPGRTLKMRIYDSWQTNPRIYKTIKVQLSGMVIDPNTIKDIFPGINESAVIAIVGEDQADPVVAAVLDRFVYVDMYQTDKPFNIWTSWSRLPDYKYWVFTDALGDPMPQTSVEIMLHSYFDESQEISLGKAVLDEKGRLEPLVLARNIYRFAFIISHPDYGKAIVEKYTPRPQAVDGILRYVAPFVPIDSQAALRAIRGTVVDRDGYALEGIPITCLGLLYKDDSRIDIYEQSNGKAITDENGWFTMYVPIEEEGLLSRRLIPPGARYSLSVRSPKSLNMNEHVEYAVPSGGEVLITLTPMSVDKRFHTFAFEDGGDIITDPQELKKIKITYIRNRVDWKELTYGQWKDGCYLQSGTLRATMIRWDRPFTFSRIEVGPESPKELVFKIGDQIVYEGSVVEYKTNKPMTNILVLVKRFRPKGGFSFTDDELDSLRTRALNSERMGLSSKTLYENDNRVALTDANGCYRFVFLTGIGDSLDHFIVLEKGYATDQTIVGGGREPNREGIVELPAIHLIPDQIKYWPALVFEDASGTPIADPNLLERIHFVIEHGTERITGRSTHTYNSLIDSDELISGTYYATLDGKDKRLIYEPVMISWGGPLEVVFKVKDVESVNVLYRGRIIHGVTGLPVPGAIVANPCNPFEVLDASGIQPEQWDAIHSVDLELDPNHPALVPLRESFWFERITRTDVSGYFKIALKRDSSDMRAFLIAVQEHYLAAVQLLKPFKPDADGYVQLPAMKLYPAGTLVLEPNLPFIDNVSHRIMVDFRIPRIDSAGWLDEFFRFSRANIRSRVYLKRDLRPSGFQTISVLAGPELVFWMNPMLPRKAPLTVPGIRLKQGGLLDLSRLDFPLAFEVTVKVINPSGEPLKGVFVKCRDLNGFSWGMNGSGQPPVTDEDGKTGIYVAEYSKGVFDVSSYDRTNRKYGRESSPYKVAGREEDEGRLFVLQLSSDEFDHLLK